MQIWRLVAHHQESEKALEEMKNRGRIAIGWSRLGDLRKLEPKNGKDISARLKEISPKSQVMMAGPSLWNLYSEVEIGDQIIVTANGKREAVFEVTGPYIFDDENSIIEYSHHRSAALTDIDPELLWRASGSDVATGQNVRWTLAKCKGTKASSDIVYFEGRRFSVISTAIERDSLAREKCLKHFGNSCQVCGMNFSKVYGAKENACIHVHHRVDLAHSKGEHSIDPIKDLIPLCPNCHAMAHTETPAMAIEKLKQIYNAKNA